MNRLLILLALAIFAHADGQVPDKAFLDSIAAAGKRDTLFPAFGFAWAGESSFAAAYGIADLENQTPVSVDSTLFQLGSIGKIFTVVSILQLEERGLLDIHDDIGRYIDIPIQNPYPTKVTLFHLLTHTSGIDDPMVGYLAKNESAIQELGGHLRKRKLAVFIEPGTEINYSNYGYALAGYIVQRVSGLPYAAYVSNHILRPLQMSQTTFRLPDNYRQQPKFARGYELNSGFDELHSYPRHAVPAGSILSTVSDMSRFLEALVQQDTIMLRRGSYEKLFQTQFTNHPLLTGYSLGFEVQSFGGQAGFGKGGNIPGFLASLVIVPSEKSGWFACTNTETDNFLIGLNQALQSRLFPVSRPRPAINISPDEFTGIYRHDRYHHGSIEDLFALVSGSTTFFQSNGKLACKRNGRTITFHPVEARVFENDSDPNEVIAFSGAAGTPRGAFTTTNVAGLSLPVSLSRVPFYDSPVLLGAVMLAVYLVIFSMMLISIFLLRRQSRSLRWSAWIAFVYSLLAAAQLFAGLLFVPGHLTEYFLGDLSTPFLLIQHFAYALPLFAAVVFACACLMLWRRTSTPYFRYFYLVFGVSALIHVAFLWHWHFIGLHL